jgi:hypothetical protein
MILFKDIKKTPKVQVSPLLYMSDDTNISKTSEFDSYMKMLNKNSSASSISINWDRVANTRSNILLNKYSINDFLIMLKKLILENKYSSYLFICHADLIINILKKVKKTQNMTFKYNKDVHIVERSSLWKIEITVNNKDIKYNKFDKIYPENNNYEPLIIISRGIPSKYGYNYEGIESRIQLFNGAKKIDPSLLKNVIKISKINSNKKQILKSRLGINTSVNNTKEGKTFNSIIL